MLHKIIIESSNPYNYFKVFYKEEVLFNAVEIPFKASAKYLITKGFSEEDELEMYHRGKDEYALKGKLKAAL